MKCDVVFRAFLSTVLGQGSIVTGSLKWSLYILAHGPFRERSAKVPERHLVFRLFVCGVRVTHGLHSSSFLWFISRILKKAIPKRNYFGARGFKVYRHMGVSESRGP